MALKLSLTPLPPPKPKIEMLSGRTTRVKVQGPTEAALLILLWENFLCKLDPSRETRDGPNNPSRQWATARLTEMRVIPSLTGMPNSTWQGVFAQTGVALPPDIYAALWAPVIDARTGQMPDKPSEECRHKIARHRRFLNSRARTWLAQIIGGLSTEYVLPGLRIRAEEPTHSLVDRDNVTHCPNGPARVYADGTCVFFWRGTLVPTGWLPYDREEWRCGPVRPRTMLIPVDFYKPPTAESALRESNLELRRAACEILGWDAIVRQLNPLVLDRDPDPEIGELLRVRLPGTNSWERSTDMHFLRVQCGTGRTFCLSVPPECSTAREANAWTYGLDPHEYSPEVRT